MSKNSAKSLYSQLMEWIPTLKSKIATDLVAKEQPGGKFSKNSYYKAKGVQ
jgi:hypothetical protein